ncbi:hypothetical protein J132_08658 [Termitomyces sp. J132]|nr:hypothetical protein J132_08658 [Termitomyces sp. J132]
MEQRASEAIEGLLDVSKEWKEREVRPARGLLAVFLEGTGTAEPAVDTSDTTNSQPEPSSGKKFALFSDTTLTDQEHLIRRMRKELAKGSRVELVLSAKKTGPSTIGLEDDTLSVNELQVRAGKLIKILKGEAKEWRKREYKPMSAKLFVFLEKEGGPAKGKVVVHKGPKPKKIKPSDIPDLTLD